jgi:dihydrofolate reductase
MGKVFSHMTMSLDGFIADPQDGVAELFDWYQAGDVTVPSHAPGYSFQVDPDSAAMLRGYLENAAVIVCGRRLFDYTDGWGGQHPAADHVVVVTHRRPEDADRWKTTTFTDSVEAGIAEAKRIARDAGDKDVTIASASIAAQALDLGLVDEVHVSLVPVLLGEGIPYFANLTRAPHRFEDPVVIQGTRATHLKYTVRTTTKDR